MGARSIGFVSRSICVHVTDNIDDRVYRGLFTSPIQVLVERPFASNSLATRGLSSTGALAGARGASLPKNAIYIRLAARFTFDKRSWSAEPNEKGT